MKIFDRIFLIRPVLLAPVWTMLLLGYYHGKIFQKVPPQILRSDNLREIMPVFLLMTALVGGIYIINQIYDRETDRLNHKLFLISDGHVTVARAWRQAVALYVAAVFGAAFISPSILVIFILCILLGFAYSSPPLSFKNRPWISLFSNMIGHGLFMFAAGWFMVPGNHPDSLGPMLKIMLPYSLAIGITFLCTTLPDMEGDRMAGKITFSVKYGKTRTARFIALLFLLMMALSVFEIRWTAGAPFRWQSVPLLFYAGVVALPFFGVMIWNPTMTAIHLAVKVPVFVLSIIVALFFWWYFVLILLVYTGSKIYYGKKFGLNYPTFKPHAAPRDI